ncbi:MAG: hypothetical protein ACRD3O_04115 [Terriglobia bacterium]
MRNRGYILRAVARPAILTRLLVGGLFPVAGTTHIPRLRAYLAVFSALLLVTMLAVDPGFAGSASANDPTKLVCAGEGPPV